MSYELESRPRSLFQDSQWDHGSDIRLFPDYHGQNAVTHEPEATKLVDEGKKPRHRVRSANDREVTLWGNIQRRWTGSWMRELFCMALGAIFFTAIVIVLAAYDNKPLPQWKHGISLNALVSLFSTLGTLCFMVPVGAGLCQAKWLHFRKARSLADFQVFESASRGLMGSLMLLLKRRVGIIAYIGAALTILLVPLNAFVQQIIVYEGRTEVSGNASIPTAYDYNVEDFSTMGTTMKAAIYNSVLTIGSVTTNVQTKCNTGNCTWPQYTSLAICSDCADLRNRTTGLNGSNLYYVLPNGIETGWPDSTPVLSGQLMNLAQVPVGVYNNTTALNTTTSVAFRDRGAVILDYFVISSPEATLAYNTTPRVAMECILQYCVKSYTATMTNGVLDEREVASYVNNTFSPVSSIDQWRYWFRLPGLARPYVVDEFVADNTAAWMATAFSGNVTGGPSGGDVAFSSDISQAVWETYRAGLSFQDLAAKIARSMTVALRTVESNGSGITAGDFITPGYNLISEGTPPPAYFNAPGTASKWNLFVRIRWGWLALLGAVIPLEILFGVLVIAATRASGVAAWKESSLANLFHGLDDAARYGGKDSDGEGGDLSSLTGMSERAELLHVQMRQGVVWELEQVERTRELDL